MHRYEKVLEVLKPKRRSRGASARVLLNRRAVGSPSLEVEAAQLRSAKVTREQRGSPRVVAPLD